MNNKKRYYLAWFGSIILSLTVPFFSFSINAKLEEHGIDQLCPDIAVSGTNLNCYGDANGTATVAVANGSGDYSFHWSDGENTSSINGLSVGTYTVTVKDNVSGCTVTGAYVVESPDPIHITSTIENIKCNGENTGAIDINVTGGTNPYSYSWKNSSSVQVSTSQDLTSAPAGNYTINISDNHSCTYSQSFVLSEPAEPLSYSFTSEDASCFGNADGSIDLQIWGGTPSYTYSWSTGASTQDVSNLSKGNYAVTVTDFNGCTLPLSFTIDQPDQLLGNFNITDVNCFGETNGTIGISLNGGTTPYSYQWKNSTDVYSQNSAVLTNIPSDMYQVTVTDAKGCLFVDSAMVNQPSDINYNYTFKNISCFGGNDGYIHLSVSGGSPVYSYNWVDSNNTVVSTQKDIDNMTASSYTCTITDTHGCTKEFTQKLIQPLSPIVVNVSKVDVLCYGNNTGEINLSVTGGVSPYSYNWATGQTTSEITDLVSGTYNYVVSDSHLCTYSGSVYIAQPAAPIAVSTSITNVNCFGESNGKIILNPTGGTMPYSYSWKNSTYNLSVVSNELNNIPADSSYIYLLTDAHNCTFTDTLIVSQPPKLMTTISGVNILCKGGNNGSVDLNVFGGVTPYSYNWNNSATTQDLNNLYAGDYNVTVTDDHGCQIKDSITLTEPQDSLSYTYTVKNVTCNNGQDGAINLTINGGTVEYHYNWSNGDTIQNVLNLTAGVYQFIVTDHNNCTLSDSILVSQPDPISTDKQIIPVSCFGMADGKINITPHGGTAPYRYYWLNSDYVLSTEEQNLVNFPTDTYQVQITDTNGCHFKEYIVLPQPDSLIINYKIEVESCYGSQDGSVLVDITGGNPAYNTTWSNGATTEDLTNVPAGHYQLNVVDQKGCSDSISVDITQPQPITMTFKTTKVSCIDQHDGTALVNPIGGNGGYTFAWSNGQTNAYIDNLYSEVYTVTVSDILGCSGTDSVFVPRSLADCIKPVTAFTPNGDNYNDTWVIDNMELYPNADMKIFNKWGNLVFHGKGLYNPWNGEVNHRMLPSGVYYYIINLNHKDRKPVKGNITIIR